MIAKDNMIVQVKMPKELVAEIDRRASNSKMSRSRYVLECVRTCMASSDFIKSQPDIMRDLSNIKKRLDIIKKQTGIVDWDLE